MTNLRSFQITQDLKCDAAARFIEDVKRGSYYFFAGRSFPYAAADVPPPVTDSARYRMQSWRAMLFGKKINPEDVTLSFKRVDWQSGQIYERYDDRVSFDQLERHYAIVRSGANRRVYLCLDNGGRRPSITEPSGSDPEPFYSPIDGYVWKYMFTIPEAIWRKFATTEYAPLVEEPSMIAQARPASLPVIDVINSGAGYANWLIGEFESSADIRVDGNNLLYGLGSQAASIDDFYNNCILRITSGAARDEYRWITDYYISGGRRVAVLNAPFTGTILPSDTFTVYPAVFVFDAGREKITNCVAVGVVSSSSNSISRVEVYESGTGYDDVEAVVIPDPSVGVTTSATFWPILTSRSGHGSQPALELGCRFVTVSIRFNEGEIPFPEENDYRQIGIMRDPQWSNVTIKLEPLTTKGTFLPSEDIYTYRSVELPGTASLTINNTDLVGAGTKFTSLRPGDELLLVASGAQQRVSVVSVTDDENIVISPGGVFTSGACSVHLITQKTRLGKLIARTIGDLTLDEVTTRDIELRDLEPLLGSISHATAKLKENDPATITVSGRNIDPRFTRFTQMFTCVGERQAGSFLPDESITQDWPIIYATPTGKVHSIIESAVVDSDILRLTDVRFFLQNRFSPDSDGVIRGNESEALFDVISINKGDLHPRSGQVIYWQHLDPITRQGMQTEIFKITLEF